MALTLTVAACAFVFGAQAAIAAKPAPAPDSMAALGDSITRAFDSGGSCPAFQDCPADSWSTGTNPIVQSHYQHLLGFNPDLAGHNFNDAVSGARVGDLASQAQAAVSQQADYVTILIGANDACTPSEATMTPVATFRSQLLEAMRVIKGELPRARVLVLSIPNIYRLWELSHTSSAARFIWGLAGICQSMLANPTSTAQADVDRRARVLQRVRDFNDQLEGVCAIYSWMCVYDQDLVFDNQFATADVSTIDYFHPSLVGQGALALSFDQLRRLGLVWLAPDGSPLGPSG